MCVKCESGVIIGVVGGIVFCGIVGCFVSIGSQIIVVGFIVMGNVVDFLVVIDFVFNVYCV